MIHPGQRMQQSAGETAGYADLLVREHWLRQRQGRKRYYEARKYAKEHGSAVSRHVVERTRKRRPKNQNIDTAPIA
jgi:hypothetical protein